MPLVFQHARQPPDGHSFADKSGYVVKSTTLNGLLSAIASYRSNNGIYAGNPAVEVEKEYATKYPWLVTKIGEETKTYIDPVAQWVQRLWRDPPSDFVYLDESHARAAICLNCPHYAADHKFSQDINRRLIILGAGELKKMGACKAHHLACGLAALMRNPTADLAIDRCWISLLSNSL